MPRLFTGREIPKEVAQSLSLSPKTVETYRARIMKKLNVRDTVESGVRSVVGGGRIPVLGHGRLKVWDSLAIGEYLAERYPSAGLWPAARCFAGPKISPVCCSAAPRRSRRGRTRVRWSGRATNRA